MRPQKPKGWHKHPCAELGRTTFGVQNLYTFPTQKRASNKSNNLICRPDSARKRKMRKMLFWNFWSFQFQSRWQGVWDFWGFWGFQFTMQFTRWTAVLRILRFSVSIALTRCLRFFCPTGTRDTIILLEGVPSRWPPRGPAIIPPKALRILVRICSQVPAKVQSALLVACVRSLEGRREGESKKQTTHQKTKTKLSSATPNRDKTIHCQRKRNVAAESAPHPRHAAKACDNNTQTIPNNIVLWQRWATCRRGWRHWISNGVPWDPAILLDLQKHCGLLKPC